MNRFADNPLRTRADLARLAADMISPLIPCLSGGRARLDLGDTGAAYDAAVAGMEGTGSTPGTGSTGATSGPSTSAWWRWP